MADELGATTTSPALVIFDCDGVLVDSERMEIGTIAEALGWVGSDADPSLLHGRMKGGVLADLLAMIAADIGAPLPDDFEARYRVLQTERLQSVSPVPGARDAVAAAERTGAARCVVSGGPVTKMRASLGATGLWDLFAPHIFSCYDIGDHKPSPGIYVHALDRFGVAAGECLAIEDSANGVRAAAAAGVPVVGLARDTDPAELVAAGAHRTVESMHDFAALVGS